MTQCNALAVAALGIAVATRLVLGQVHQSAAASGGSALGVFDNVHAPVRMSVLWVVLLGTLVPGPG